MNISNRLKEIGSMVDKCETICDIGTDHAYLPIYLIKKGVCDKAIASDINKGPVDKAKNNVQKEKINARVSCRLGAGLTTIEPFEADGTIIAGMGGNLIRDIIEDSKDVFKSFKFAVLQPVQNPEILRKYIYDSGYDIIDEELCFDEGKYYEIIKIKYNNNSTEVEDIYYEISKKLIEKKHPLVKKYVEFKLHKYGNILTYIKEDTEMAKQRKNEIEYKINKLEEILKCL